MILNKFPTVLWINLDKSIDRRLYMEKFFKTHGINHIRIPAIDGTDPTKTEVEDYCTSSPYLSKAENACTCSHFKALRYFLHHLPDESRIVIFEDDVSDEFLRFIPFDWADFEDKLPTYNVIQLAVTSRRPITRDFVKYEKKKCYCCSAAYLVTKTAAESLIKIVLATDGTKLDFTKVLDCSADGILYSLSDTFTIPLFTTLTNQSSTVHNGEVFKHQRSKKQQMRMWILGK